MNEKRPQTDELEDSQTVVCTKLADEHDRTRWTVRIQAADQERPVIVRGGVMDTLDTVLDVAANELRRRRRVSAVA